MTCDRLLWVLYEETGIYAFVGSVHGGDEAQANLRLLFERAKAYENSGYKGLFHFIGYMERLEKKDEDMAGAKLVGEGHDVVRIMTIHKSKGLEFPVVFLAGCGKEFNIIEKSIPLHKKWGLGLEEINVDKGYRRSTIAKQITAAANVAESISEEERKLYVAMTRAKEKLIVTGVVNTSKTPFEKYEEKWDSLLPDRESVINPEDVCAAKCFLDWIAPVARYDERWIYKSVSGGTYNYEDRNEANEEFDEEIQISDFKYNRTVLKYVPSKVSVTDIKSGSFFEKDTDIMPVPAFLEENTQKSGADRGNALHAVMQNFIPKENMTMEYVSEEIKKMAEKKIITPEQVQLADGKKILAFYNSDLGGRILRCGKVMRETPFETDIPLSFFEGYEEFNDKILLQGVIDCWFEEDGKIILIDYKSDFYTYPREIEEKYKNQLNRYQYALEKITGKKVAEKYIYMFHNNDVLKCE